MKKILTMAFLGLMTTLSPSNAENFESEFDRWIVRFRMIDVHPDTNQSVTGLNANAHVENDIVPEIDFTYFWTKNIATELILATSEHEVYTNNGIDLGDTWVLPPQLTMQYHFRPEKQIRPYVGAGVGYIMYYGGNSGAVNSVEYDDGFSYTLQAGVDIGLDDDWALNFDVKRIFHNTNVSINGGAITADVDLNPWVFGAGLAYRF